LISFLNAILYQSKPIIEDLTVLDPCQAPRIEGMKNSHLDIKAKLTGNRSVIIEMQVLNVLGFEKRVLYNAAKAFSIQLEVGQDYTLLNPVIALTITDFEMFEQSDFEYSEKVISRYRLKEKDDLTEYRDDIELVFVELPKFKKALDELEDLSDKWLYFLKSADQLQAVPSSLDTVSAIHKAFEVARHSGLNREELEILERQAMFLHDSRNAIRKAVQDGEARGLARVERNAKIAIARSLLNVLPVETISQTTGLSLIDIEALKHELQ
jgi:predicted transposase/invertase (TIGR01784 family)